MNNIHIFTSCTNSYIPKARTLGNSLKKYHPSLQFHLVLSDEVLADFDLNNEPFDSIISINEFGIDNLESWIFQHSIVELCTAVKPLAFQEIIRKYHAEKVFYFDPDIVIFNPLDDLINTLNNYSILLTPHQLHPEEFEGAILYNEQIFLKYGTFNLGFLGLKNSPEGLNFLDWWCDRSLKYCYDDIENGIFTDQKLIDLAPSFFSELHILRNPVYNVATWNLTHRLITGNLDSGIFVNNQPLCFYHFSNAQVIMQREFKVFNEVVTSLWHWYKQQLAINNYDNLENKPCIYSHFENGITIEQKARLIYRQREDLQKAFTNPFNTQNQENSFYNWYQNYEKEEKYLLEKEKLEKEKLQAEINNLRHYSQQLESINKSLEKKLEENQKIIQAIESSKFWQMRNLWFKLKGKLGLSEKEFYTDK